LRSTPNESVCAQPASPPLGQEEEEEELLRGTRYLHGDAHANDLQRKLKRRRHEKLSNLSQRQLYNAEQHGKAKVEPVRAICVKST